MPISKSTAIMYLLAASQDCDGSSPAPNKNAGFAASAASGAEIVAGLFGLGRVSDPTGMPPGAAIRPGPLSLASFSAFVPSLGETSPAALGVAETVPPAATAWLATDGATAAMGNPAAFDAPTAVSGTVDARVPPAGGAFNCPRHFFSSHSTQSDRPAETGNPHAWHCCRLRSTGGTWLWSASSAFAASAGFTAADQNNSDFFPGSGLDGVG